jgi:hypothetical protein
MAMKGSPRVTDPPATNKRLEIRLGSLVVGSDGVIGLVEQVLIDPVSRQARGLAIATRTPRRPLTVPFAAVASADGCAVQLGASGANLLQAADAQQTRARDRASETVMPHREVATRSFPTASPIAMAGRHRGAAEIDHGLAALTPLTAGQTVLCRDGTVGHIDLVLLDEQTHCVTHLVVRCSDARRRDVRVPLWWLSEITLDHLVLDAAWEQLDRCPGYRPDDEITGDVQATVLRLSALDPKDFWQIEVRTRAGIVELHGLTRTDCARATLERLTSELKGVVAVRNGVKQLKAKAATDRDRSTPDGASGWSGTS